MTSLLRTSTAAVEKVAGGANARAVRGDRPGSHASREHYSQQGRQLDLTSVAVDGEVRHITTMTEVDAPALFAYVSVSPRFCS